MKEFITHSKELGFVFIAMGNHWRVLSSEFFLNCIQIILIVNEEMIAKEPKNEIKQLRRKLTKVQNQKTKTKQCANWRMNKETKPTDKSDIKKERKR